MRILAYHNLEEVAKLLTDLTFITEVEVSSVPIFEKFKEYLSKYKFNAVILLDKFFLEGIEYILSNQDAPKSVAIFLQNENDMAKYLRLGVADFNLENIPFNPLTFFVKLRNLINATNQIKKLLEEGQTQLDFYRYGLFNVLNVFTSTDKNVFLSVKNAEEDEVLYSIRIRNGQVVSTSVELEKIIEINLDDSLPKLIAIEPVTHSDLVVFKNTAEFYKALLEAKIEESSTTAGEISTVSPKAEKPDFVPQKVEFLRVNPLRERRVYSFPYKGYTFYTQPYENLRNLEKTIFAVTQIDDYILSSLRVLKIKGGDFKILTSPLIKSYLKLQGFKEKQFITLEGVKIFEFPNLGSRLECLIYLPEGVLISGNLFGSYVSRDITFFDRVFSSHLRLYHLANITCKHHLEKSLEKVEHLLGDIYYIIPNYGYAIDVKQTTHVFNVLKDLDFLEEFNTLQEAWSSLQHIFPENVESYDGLLNILKRKDPALLYTFIDEMEALSIIPYEF